MIDRFSYTILEVNQALKELGLVNTNRFAAYVYLVVNGVVRWRAVGNATEKELQYMKQVTRSLTGDLNITKPYHAPIKSEKSQPKENKPK